MLIILALSMTIAAQAQEVLNPIKIEDEQFRNRLHIYALNQTLNDYDVTITIQGTGIRIPSTKPRKVRVPGRSKVNLISLVVERDKTPQYTYELDVSDSLSRRVLLKDAELIRIPPKHPITIIVPEKCASCDTLISGLEESPYTYKVQKLAENESMKTQLAPFLKSSGYDADSMETPVVMLGGKMYLDIENYPDLYAKLEE